MAIEIPTTQELTDQNITRFESRLNQTIPDNDQAFVRVLSVVEAMIGTSLNKLTVERALQNLTLTATGDDLDRIGIEYGVTRKPAVAAIHDIIQLANNGISIPAGTEYVGDSNGVRYFTNATVVAAAGQADLEITAKDTGDVGNLTSGDTLTIGAPIAGITSTSATYSATVTAGTDRETDSAYRRRVLNEIRTVGGGSNKADYRTWSEESASVYRSFPYAGAHTTSPTTKLTDDDMELSGTTYWTAGNNATITKNASAPQEGTQNLRVAYLDTSNPYAKPASNSLTVGKSYTFTGWVKGDGSNVPSLRDSGGLVIATGSATAAWILISGTFVATGADLYFYSSATGAGFVEFDNFTLTCDDSWAGDRTVYIECLSSIEPDGIPTQAILDEARSYINTDPDTSLSRPALGTTDENLYVEPIYRTTLYVLITELDVSAAILAQVQSDIYDAIDEYFREITPYVDGLDFEGDRVDEITNLTLSAVIQDILNPVGGSAETVVFGLASGVPSPLGSYTLGRGEETKLGGVTYA